MNDAQTSAAVQPSGAYPSFDQRPHTFPELLLWQSLVAPSGPAFTAADGHMSFDSWARRAVYGSAALHSRGVRAGSLVGLWGDNSHGCAWAAAMLAVQWLGAIPVPMNSRMGLAGVEEMLNDLGASHLITARADGEGGAAGALTRVFFDELAGSATGGLPPPACDDADPVGIYHTSGTTGRPKPIILSHVATTFIAAATEDHILGPPAGVESLCRSDVLQSSVALHTTSGLMHMLAVCLFSGVHLICEPRFNVESTIRTAVEEGSTIWFGVPAMMTLLGDGQTSAVPDAHLRVLWHAGSIVSGSSLAGVRTIFPEADTINLYSLTESGAAMASSQARDAIDAPGTVGRPLPTASLLVVKESGEVAAPGEVGEVMFSSPYMYDGTYDKGLVRPPGLEDGWLRTGDAGYLDEDGRLWLTGRLGEVMIRGGYNIYPAMVERVLMEHSDVVDAAVVAIPHRVLGDDLVAIVAARRRTDAGKLQEHCRRALADYEVPRTILFIDELPRGDFGKLDRRRLTAFAQESVAS